MSVERLGIDLSTEEKRQKYKALYNGLRDEGDPVSWRTTITDIRALLGSSNPSHELPITTRSIATNLIGNLVSGTYLEPLTAEILCSVGINPEHGERLDDLDALLVNAKHTPDGLLWKVAEHLLVQGKRVAVINPVGHYRDKQTRIAGPNLLSRRVDKVVFISSTQEMYGGNLGVLVDTIGLLRNPDFSSRIKDVLIVIPMFGGSRGHKLGQSPEVSYEVLQTESDAKILLFMIQDILKDLGRDTPNVSILSVDIHNDQLPGNVFKNGGIDFISVCPTREFAHAVQKEIIEQKLTGLPVRVVGVDQGAVPRTRRFAGELLRILTNSRYLELVEVAKERSEAGEVKSVQIKRAVRLIRQDNGNIREEELESINSTEKFIRITSDDMLDTGGSAESDDLLLDDSFDAAYKIMIVTHPIMSLGVPFAIEKVKSTHVVMVGDTLEPPNLNRYSKIRVVSVAPAIVRSMQSL